MAAEGGEILGAEVGHFVLLPVAPDVLGGVQLGRVRREILEREAPALRRDVLADEAAAVGGEVIPDDEQLPRQMPLEVLEKLDHLRRLDGPREEAEVEVPPRHPRDRREQFPAEVILQDGRLPARRPGPAAMRPLGQSALVDEDERLPVGGSVFFSAGQRTRFHRRMAASSRSSARPVGRWQLHPSCLRSRHTWPG